MTVLPLIEADYAKSEVRFTPGPWRLEKKRTQFHIRGTSGQLSLELHSNQFAAEANARLIAQSPCMFAALEPIEAQAVQSGIYAPELDDDEIVSVSLTVGELRKIKSVLSKVRGSHE